MLNAYNVRMTSHGLKSEKVSILEEVLSIKFSVKHSISIFAIVHFQKFRYGGYPTSTHKSLDMVVVLLTFKKKKKSKYGCCHVGIFKSTNMVVILLTFKKKKKSPDMTDILLTLIKA